MDDYLRQLLEMMNAVPAPGRTPTLPNSTTPVQDLGRVGGNPQQAARMPTVPMQDNGLGSMEPAPQYPAFDPEQTYVQRGAPWQQRGSAQYPVQPEVEGMPFDPEQTMVTRAQPAQGRHVAFSEKTTPMQPSAQQAPVIVQVTPELLKHLAGKKRTKTAED